MFQPIKTPNPLNISVVFITLTLFLLIGLMVYLIGKQIEVERKVIANGKYLTAHSIKVLKNHEYLKKLNRNCTTDTIYIYKNTPK